jgi:two-component system, LytTR family, response regulator
MKLRTIIADDEHLALRRLVLALRHIEEIELVGTARDGASALALIGTMRPDLVIVDIQMPGMSGLQLIDALDRPSPPEIIFVTAFAEFAAQAFDQGIVDYVLKPVGEERLKRAVARARERLRSRDAEHRLAELREFVARLSSGQEAIRDSGMDLWISDRGIVLRVPAGHVDWFEAAGDYVVVHTDARSYVIHDSLRSLETRLDRHQFRRTHRSAIVRLGAVASLERLKFGALRLRLSNGSQVGVGRTYRKSLEQALRAR